jgi:hypothetical protein
VLEGGVDKKDFFFLLFCKKNWKEKKYSRFPIDILSEHQWNGSFESFALKKSF